MINSFMESESASKAVAYCEGPMDSSGRKRDFPPEFLFGRPELLLEACEHSPVVNTHNSSALAFTETREVLGVDRLSRILKKHAEIARGGLPYARVPDVGYGHFELTGSHGHLVQLGFDLLTGLQLPVWSMCKYLINFYNKFHRLIELEEGLSSSGDPWLQRFLAPVPRKLPCRVKKEFRQVDYELTVCAGDGFIWSREGLIQAFKWRGYQLDKTDDNGFSVINKEGYWLRFSGAKYARDFDFERIVQARQVDRVRDPEAVDNELKVLQPEFSLLLEQRYEYFARRFGEKPLDPMGKMHRKLLQAYGGGEETGWTPSHEHPAADESTNLATDGLGAPFGQEPSIFKPENKDAGDEASATPAQTTERSNASITQETQHHHEHTGDRSKPNEITRIGQRRRVRARAIVRSVGAEVSRACDHLRSAVAASVRTGERARDNQLKVEGALGLCRELSQVTEEYLDQERGGGIGENLRRYLEQCSGNCSCARAALTPEAAPVDPLAAIRDPVTGIPRLIQTPKPNLNITHHHVH